VNFLKLPERVNTLLYRRQVKRLTKTDMESAKQWTLQLIRDRNPHWSEERIQDYYDHLLDIRLVAIDQWSARLGEIRHI
jgi:ribonucleotide reductase beta subunit family protein with ferritin-like domain